MASIYINRQRKEKWFDRRDQAERWALEMKHSAEGGEAAALGKTLRDALQRYAREIAPAHKGARWEALRCKKFERDEIATMPLSALRREHFGDWIQRQTISAGSIRRELTLLASVLRAARDWGWMDNRPMQDLRKPKPPPPRDRRLLPIEQERILLAFDWQGEVTSPRHVLAVAMLLALETAMRQGELFDLTWDRVCLKTRTVRLVETKNGARREVPLSKEALRLLKLLPRTDDRVIPLNQASAGQLFRRACQIAGVQDFRFHDLRHEAITRLARKLDMLDLARMVGHRDPRSLTIYYNATAAEIAKRLD